MLPLAVMPVTNLPVDFMQDLFIIYTLYAVITTEIDYDFGMSAGNIIYEELNYHLNAFSIINEFSLWSVRVIVLNAAMKVPYCILVFSMFIYATTGEMLKI